MPEKSKYFTLAKIQGEINNVVASKTAGESSKKSWKFADLASVQEVIKTKLKDNNVSVVFTSTKQTDKSINFVYTTQYASKEITSNIYEITAVLYFADSDDSLEFTYEVPFDTNMNKAIDGWGGMTTYARRYILCMIFNIPIEDLKEPNLEKEKKPATEQAKKLVWLTYDQFKITLASSPAQIKKVLAEYDTDTHKMLNSYKTQLEAKLQQPINSELPDIDVNDLTQDL